MANFPTNDDDVIVGTVSGETIDALLGDDVVFGAGGGDTLLGNGGNDQLNGGDGLDTLNGGKGNDWADYSFVSGGVIANLTLGYGFQSDLGLLADKDTYFSIENVNGGSGNDTLTGNKLGNRLKGNGGSDSFSPGDGNDKVDGGTGDDFIIGSQGKDVNDGGDGFDTLYYHLSPDAVKVDLAAGTASGGYAEGDKNLGIEGINGSQHDDALRGAAGSNHLIGLNGGDTLIGRGGNDSLLGENGDDRLNGGGGNDELWGSLGQDDMTGGAGADHFNYATIDDSAPFMPKADVIADFNQGEDKIDVHLIDAKPETVGDDAFIFRGTLQYLDGVAGQIRVTFSGGITVVSFRTDLSGTDMFIVLDDSVDLTANDFFL